MNAIEKIQSINANVANTKSLLLTLGYYCTTCINNTAYHNQPIILNLMCFISLRLQTSLVSEGNELSRVLNVIHALLTTIVTLGFLRQVLKQ